MQAFTDLVGTAVVPAHCFDSAELTDLTPALDTATAAHDMADQASEASYLSGGASPYWPIVSWYGADTCSAL